MHARQADTYWYKRAKRHSGTKRRVFLARALFYRRQWLRLPSPEILNAW